MRTFAIKHNLTGVLALACAIAVVFAIALEADAGLGPAGRSVAPEKASTPSPGSS